MCLSYTFCLAVRFNCIKRAVFTKAPIFPAYSTNTIIVIFNKWLPLLSDLGHPFAAHGLPFFLFLPVLTSGHPKSKRMKEWNISMWASGLTNTHTRIVLYDNGKFNSPLRLQVSNFVERRESERSIQIRVALVLFAWKDVDCFIFWLNGGLNEVFFYKDYQSCVSTATVKNFMIFYWAATFIRRQVSQVPGEADHYRQVKLHLSFSIII